MSWRGDSKPGSVIVVSVPQLGSLTILRLSQTDSKFTTSAHVPELSIPALSWKEPPRMDAGTHILIVCAVPVPAMTGKLRGPMPEYTLAPEEVRLKTENAGEARALASGIEMLFVSETPWQR